MGRPTVKRSIYEKVVSATASNTFFYIIVGILILQALWYALSFQPILFDEARHIEFIRAYTHHLFPFIQQQPQNLDVIGEVTRDPSYLFFYIMSWPFRVIEAITSNSTAQVILLRLLSLSLAVIGLFFYRRAFLVAGAPKSIVNIALLTFVLIPSIALYPGAVHYDNAIFMLFGLALLLAVKLLKSNDVSFKDISLLLIIGLLGTLVKFTFAALFAPIVMFLAFAIWKKHGKRSFPLFAKSFNKTSTVSRVILILALVVSVGLFIERPVLNIAKYHQLQPDCQKLMTQQRCLTNYTAKRNLTLLQTKPVDFKPVDPFTFAFTLWTPSMLSTQVRILPDKGALPIMLYLFYGLVLGGIALTLIFLRDFLKNKGLKFLIFTAAAYTLFLFLYLYTEYAKYGAPVALSGRYLLQVMPIFLLFTIWSVAKLLRQHQTVQVGVLVAFFVLMTQGGSISSQLLSAGKEYYWQNPVVQQGNEELKTVVDKLTLSRIPFRN